MLVTLLIMTAGTLGVSNWVGGRIEAGVIQQNGATAALSVDSFITPQLQGLGGQGQLDISHLLALQAVLGNTPLGKWVVAYTVRDMSGRLLFSSDPSLVNLAPPTASELASVMHGLVTSEIDRLESDRDSALRKYSDRLVKTYSPARLYNTGSVIAVIEFYQDVDTLQAEIDAARWQSWIVVGAFMIGMYVLLALFSRWTGATIDRQRTELNSQVIRLTDLLSQNQQLHVRVRQAAASVATLHERLLRRIGAELHDGPAQDLSLALMQMDTVRSRGENGKDGSGVPGTPQLLANIEDALKRALAEVRGISSGLSLPQLVALTPTETISHAARAHERRTGTKVSLDLKDLPDALPLPVKITIYRLVQEALNNIFKHAGGAGQQVSVNLTDGNLSVQISDSGPGFNVDDVSRRQDHLGLEGMRERVESLGGTFQVESQPGSGTRIRAILNLKDGDVPHG